MVEKPRLQITEKLLTSTNWKVVVDKHQKKTLVIDVAIPSERNIRENYNETEKYQGLEKDLKEMCKVETTAAMAEREGGSHRFQEHLRCRNSNR